MHNDQIITLAHLETKPQTCSSLHGSYIYVCIYSFDLSSHPVCRCWALKRSPALRIGTAHQILTDGWKWPRLRGGDTLLCLLTELVRPLTRILLPAGGIICPRARRLPASLTRPPTSTLTSQLTPPAPESWRVRALNSPLRSNLHLNHVCSKRDKQPHLNAAHLLVTRGLCYL